MGHSHGIISAGQPRGASSILPRLPRNPRTAYSTLRAQRKPLLVELLSGGENTLRALPLRFQKKDVYEPPRATLLSPEAHPVGSTFRSAV